MTHSASTKRVVPTTSHSQSGYDSHPDVDLLDDLPFLEEELLAGFYAGHDMNLDLNLIGEVGAMESVSEPPQLEDDLPLIGTGAGVGAIGSEGAGVDGRGEARGRIEARDAADSGWSWSGSASPEEQRDRQQQQVITSNANPNPQCLHPNCACKSVSYYVLILYKSNGIHV